jgi:large subunit ribosomal protein L30
MTTNSKPTTKPKASAAKATPKAEEASAPKVAKTSAKAAAPKSSTQVVSGTVTVKQIGSAIGRQEYQRKTLIALGLNKIGREHTLPDTASTRGRIAAVHHLVTIVAEGK